MNMRILLLSALLGAALNLGAQTNMGGHQNIARQERQNWKSVSSENFDAHYYSEDPMVGGLALKYAEEALWDVSRLFDYTNRSRFAFYIFFTPEDLVRSNLYPQRMAKEGGVTPIRTNTAPLLFPGSHQEFQKVVRREVTRLLMEDFYYGGGIQASIQNTVLLYLPEWYAEGFPAYIGEGWTYTDELWFSSLENTNLLNFTLEGNDYIHHVARKSIWYFIASQYGKEKIAEIFYMTRLTRSVEDGIVHVLGITLKTLTERWREFMLQRISENHTFRESLGDQATKVRLGTNERLLNFAVHPKEPIAAVYLEDDGKHRIALYDIDARELTSTPVKGGWKTDQFQPFIYEMPMAWSPDGKTLMAVVPTKQGEQLAYWNRETDEVKYVGFQSTLQRIFQASWSHDGRQVVVSGLRNGTIDLYRTIPGNSAFIQLTNDLYDDTHPVWSLDDQRIYYASTRDNDTIEASDIRFDANTRSYDLWEVDLEGGSLRQVSHSIGVDEMPVAMVSSFELLVRTNQTGLYNLERRNVFVGDSVAQTNLTPGIYQISMNDSLAVFSVPDRGRLVLYQAPLNTFLHDVVALRSPLRMRDDKGLLAAGKAAQQQAKRDSVRKAQRDAELKATEGIPADSAGKEKKVKYYVFDEPGETDAPRRPRNNTRPTVLRKEAPLKPDFDALMPKGNGASGTQWVADRVTTRLGFDPVFKLNMLFEARLRDQQGNHHLAVGFKPFIDLKSGDGYLQYTNAGHKLDYFVGLSRSTRFLNKFDFTVRYNATRLDGGVILPLTRFLSIGGGGHAVYIDRHNMELRVPKPIDGNELLAGGRFNITFERTQRNGSFIKSGHYGTVNVENAFSFKGMYNQFTTLTVDLRKYIPVRNVVLATRFTGGWSAGRYPQRFYMGGTDEWLFSHFNNAADFPIQGNLADFHYMEYITPLHGFRFNARNGARYLVANAELRIPVSRIFKSSLNTNPLYNLELIPFFDLGTAWTTGNPLSQRNPIDTETIDSYPLSITVQTLKSPFIMGFGAGSRLQVFGYSARVDLAWGVDDYTLLTPRLHLSLAKNF